jgi:hypothetical protein
VRTRSFLLALALLTLGCDRTAPETSDAPATAPTPAPTPAAAAPNPPGPPAGPGDVDELHRLEGTSEADVLAEFGAPTSKREFRMADCCHEFEIELYNTYPPDKGHDDVVIREWAWDYDGYALTVWLHEVDGNWKVLETSRYNDDVEF